MAGIYGEQLSFFPELLQEHTIFRMDARKGGGYGPRYGERKVTGYWSWIKGGNMGIEGDLRTENQHATFWCHDETNGKGLIRQGEYIEEDDELFVNVHDDGFSREAGFIVYDFRLVAGLTDRQHTNEQVDLGVSDYQ